MPLYSSGISHIELSVIRSDEETFLLSPVEKDRVHNSNPFTAEKGATGFEFCWMTLGLREFMYYVNFVQSPTGGELPPSG